jgi:hypothetical protein
MVCFMPPQSESSAPPASINPRVFCKGCGYALVGLESTKCPECGRGFDLANRRTFARRPPRSALWRWGRRVLAGVLLLLLTAGTGVGWLWWGWRAEQPTIARLRGLQQQVQVSPIGPERLRRVLGKRWGYLAERVDSASVVSLGAAETEQLDLRSFAHVQKLWLIDCELSNSNLSNLAGLQKLRELELTNLTIEKPDLAFLEQLPALSSLELWGEWVQKAGCEHIGCLQHLKVLDLHTTGITDADLQQLRDLPALKELYLMNNPITDAGLEHLQGLKSLRILFRNGTEATQSGLAKLKQAIPGLQVN